LAYNSGHHLVHFKNHFTREFEYINNPFEKYRYNANLTLDVCRYLIEYLFINHYLNLLLLLLFLFKMQYLILSYTYFVQKPVVSKLNFNIDQSVQIADSKGQLLDESLLSINIANDGPTDRVVKQLSDEYV
jgi:hypothetical protein